jgi:hypothetical protein
MSVISRSNDLMSLLLSALANSRKRDPISFTISGVRWRPKGEFDEVR